MAKEIKHVGKIKNTGDKIAVVFRTIPGESNQALVLPTATLKDEYHDALMKMIESDQAQQTNELGEIMFTRTFPDGRIMLTAMEQDRRLRKVSTSDILMTPTPTDQILLSELNTLIAEQKGMTVDSLYTLVSGAPKDAPAEQSAAATETKNEGVLSDSDLAKSYRSQADAMYKEAARLRREADELDPPKKKTTAKTTSEVEA